jgi:riboflavin synthase
VSVGDRLGGHIVSGHVDCTGKVTEMHEDARSIRFTFEIPKEYARYVAKKGSVCIDGVSLTINEVSGNAFEVNIIPHTAAVTTMGGYKLGTVVNIEVDLLARYLERLLSKDGDGISLDFLKAHGYA